MRGPESLWRKAPPASRWAAAAVGVLVLTGASLMAGQVFEETGPSAEAGPDDRYTAAPGCGSVPEEAVGELVDEASLDTSDGGLMEDSDAVRCAWTSVGTGAAPRTLQVDFRAYFTDAAGETSGASAAADAVAGLEPFQRGAVAAPAALGEGALLGRAGPAGASGEAVFRDANLVVRVVYIGAADPGAGAMDEGRARDGAAQAAEAIAEAL
ncbi:hypothetical protein O4J56_28370 [Nocardiopsis sp. RSe5-2]|uniref:DUF3558 domain-containing protein n=1 Tax=Nocardiopsis endophytica TaxID=3018445 RepID=A0ABT4UC84_9ACTN|nr:hypothetical protein [Nocardiopsis endophytica]MDA2814592.1 hypothetical protein [Nocardiopsis endophytica]